MLERIEGLYERGGAGLAPMAGVTDAAMRLLCHEQGSAWAVSEMLSAKGWVFSKGKNRNACDLLKRLPGEGVAGLQLFGSAPEYMAEAAGMLEDIGFDGFLTLPSFAWGIFFMILLKLNYFFRFIFNI